MTVFSSYTKRCPFGIILGTFYMTWPDDLSRLLAASNFTSKTTLQTPKSLPGQLLEYKINENVGKTLPEGTETKPDCAL